jgi:hypothetical protein
MKSATTSIASIEKQKLCNFYTEGDLNFNSTLLYKGVLQDKNTLAWSDRINSSISYFIKDYSLKLYIILFALLLFSSGFGFAQYTGTQVIVTNAGGVNLAANGTYSYTGMSNSRPYYSFGAYRVEYRDDGLGYGFEWEIWECSNKCVISFSRLMNPFLWGVPWRP